MSRFAPWFLLVFGLAACLLGRESRQPGGSLAGVDRAFFDWLVTNARLDAPHPGEIPVTLVEIDDAIVDTPGRLPLTALEYGAFLRSMARYDPAVVAIEPVLDFVQVSSGAEQILLERALAIPKLLLAVQLGDNAAHSRDPESLPALPNGLHGNAAALPNYPEIVAAPDARLLELAAASGATNLAGASTGPVRDIPLLFRCRDRVLPAFTLQALTLSLRLARSEVEAGPGAEIRLGDRLRLPINRFGRALLDAREFGRFQRLSLDDLPLLEAGQAAMSARSVAERMRNGVVVLGRTDRAARTLRLPDGRAISPAEVFAWAATSLQHAPATRRASIWWDVAVATALAGSGLAGLGGRRWRAVAFAGATIVFYLLAALTMFEWQRLWLPVALPGGLTVLTVILTCFRPAAAASPATKDARAVIR